MEILKVLTIILYIVVCVAIVVLVLMQEGKTAGLGAISGAAETYWGKNKGRTMDGALSKATAWLGAIFIVLSIVLNLKIW